METAKTTLLMLSSALLASAPVYASLDRAHTLPMISGHAADAPNDGTFTSKELAAAWICGEIAAVSHLPVNVETPDSISKLKPICRKLGETIHLNDLDNIQIEDKK